MSDDNIIVRWKDESGCWREGVVVCLVMDTMHTTQELAIRNQIANKPPAVDAIRAIIIDRHRNERCIVQLSKVSLVVRRCEACDGEGKL